MPPPPLRSSGDLLADRRFAYAQAAFDEGDHAAAAELALQVLELAPAYAPAHALLGRAQAALGDTEAAVAALRAALAAEPDDALGVRLDLARLGALPPEAAIAPGYVRALFDDYAPRFDKHLIKNLNYRGPALIAAALRRACALRGRPFRFGHVLDLGCGTGLMGQALAGRFETLEGVDLSPKMLAKARKTRLYDRLHEGGLLEFMAAREEASADLVVAADVFVYLASLEEAFRAARRALSRDGLFAFSVQAHNGDDFGDGFALGEDARYAHAEPYLRRLAAGAGFTVALLERASTREERGEAVPGLVAVLA
jgi:predicted TPR repeat methyltransferase